MFRNKSTFLTSFFMLLFLSVVVSAQDKKLDSLSDNLMVNAFNSRSSALFVHFDKNVYTNNDQVWFSAYLLRGTTDLKNYHTIYVALVCRQDSSIILQQKFFMEDGFSFGSLTLPDSLISGSYRFIVNTNIKINNHPDGEFIQPITIKSNTINSLEANLSLFKADDPISGNGTVILKALSGDNRFVADADVTYTIGQNGQVVKSGKAKTSIIGEVMIDFPASGLTAENNLLMAVVKKNKNVRYVKMSLPLKDPEHYQVSFYPEGGVLVDGITSHVAVEIKDEKGTLITTKAILYDHDIPVDTVHTNSLGIGHFRLKSGLKHRYQLKLFDENTLLKAFSLPIPVEKGTVMRLSSSIGNEKISALLESNQYGKVHVVVHNYVNIFMSAAIDLLPKRTRKVVLNLDSVPMGLNVLSILDSNYMPLAERIFMAHYDQLERLQIQTEKEDYSTRDEVSLKLQILDKHNQPVEGVVSIACVQSNRNSVLNASNIVDFKFLEEPLKELPNQTGGYKYADTTYLNDMLLTKTWRKYIWPKEQPLVSGIEAGYDSYGYSGLITKNKKPLRIPSIINLIGSGKINSLSTDTTGKFHIEDSVLVSEPGGRVWLTLAEKNLLAYEIKLDDPDEALKPYLKSKNHNLNTMSSRALNSIPESGLSSAAGIRLKEVTITKTHDNLNIMGFGPNKCGDYVCMFNILNCPNHMGDGRNKPPQQGKKYTMPGGRNQIIYAGCSADEMQRANFLILKAVNLPKEFYKFDVENKNEPINFATIYWNYQFILDGKDKSSLSFLTGDLSGDFKIIIQGITKNGPVYGEKLIHVKRP